MSGDAPPHLGHDALCVGGWLIRSAGSAGLVAQASEARLAHHLIILLAAHAGEYGLWVSSWWLLGWMALSRIAWNGAGSWPGCSSCWRWSPSGSWRPPPGEGSRSAQGGILKRRLLFGALQLGQDEVRHLGLGRLLSGRVVESEVVESMALNGGFLGLTSAIELVIARASSSAARRRAAGPG